MVVADIKEQLLHVKHINTLWGVAFLTLTSTCEVGTGLIILQMRNWDLQRSMRTAGQKANKEIENVNDRKDQLDLTDIYRTIAWVIRVVT